MKKLNKISFFILLFVFCINGPTIAQAATAPSLGIANTYAIVSSTFTNSNTPPGTIVNGDVCFTTPPVTLPLSITGATVTPCSAGVGMDQGLALADLNSQACTSIGAGAVALDSTIVGINPPGTFPPGCYMSGGAMNITLGTTVTLSGSGVYIFRPGGALNTGDDSSVVLTNGANASDVFWVPVGLTTLGANATPSLTPTFVGNIIDNAGITLGHFANLLGRALSFSGTVTTDANTINVPTNLHIVKLVVNGSGGTAVASDFNMHVKNGGVDVLGSPAMGLGGLGTSYSSLSAGTYIVSEDPLPAGYSTTFTGDCDAGGSITLATGDDKICTIINTNIPVPIPVPAPSSSGGGGGRRIVAPLIGILKVPTPFSLSAGPGRVTYDFTVWNVGGGQALHNVTVVDDKCTTVVLLSGDTNNNSRLDIGEIWKYRCTMALSTTTTNTAVATGYNDSNQVAIATAIATVVVTPLIPGLPETGFIPPLINIVKVPNRLTPFPFGGGNVTYSYTITNPGIVPMNNIVVTDDKCAPVSRIYGDINNNNLLERSESWSYTCKTNVKVSTRNVATAIGKANGLTALSYAFATVLVNASGISARGPGFPNTGYPPIEKINPLNTIY